MVLRDRYCDYIPVYTEGSGDGYAMVRTTEFPSDTATSMRLPDPVSTFTVENWEVSKALEKINILLHPNMLFVQTQFYTHSFVI